MVRAELAVTGAQILFWAALIGVFAALAVRVVRRRRSRRELPSPGEVEPDPVLTN